MIFFVFFTAKVVKYWNKLHREVVESSSLELLKSYIDMALRHVLMVNL